MQIQLCTGEEGIKGENIDFLANLRIEHDYGRKLLQQFIELVD